MKLQNTQTLTNLMRALIGESLARNRYTFAAEQAETDGLPIVAALFRATADQEKEHAAVFADFLRRGGVEQIPVEAAFPTDVGADTLSLLAAAARNEAKEHGEVYPAFAAVARDEGFAEIARKLDQIAAVEKCHGARFEEFHRLLSQRQLFASPEACAWVCQNCGHEFTAEAAPQNCPLCGEAGYFLRAEMAPYSYGN